MNKLSEKKSREKRGFTILETIVAIFIIALATTGPLFISTRNIQISFLSKDQVVAAYLAQDALEYIKNLRDRNRPREDRSGLSHNEWLKGVNPDCFKDSGCRVNTLISNPDEAFSSCAGEGNDFSKCNALRYNNMRYTYDGSVEQESKFYREIYLTEEIPSEEIVAKVVVTWEEPRFSDEGFRSLEAVEHINNSRSIRW